MLRCCHCNASRPIWVLTCFSTEWTSCSLFYYLYVVSLSCRQELCLVFTVAIIELRTQSGLWQSAAVKLLWGTMSRVLVRELGAGRKLLRPRVDVLPRSVSTVVSISRSSTACGVIIVAGLDGSYYSERPYRA